MATKRIQTAPLAIALTLSWAVIGLADGVSSAHRNVMADVAGSLLDD